MALSLDGTTGISATGNIISSGGIISATGNIYGGNIIGTLAPSAITVSGNATVGNLLTGGLVSAAGTITGSSHLGSVVSVTANITGGNILTGGLISAVANVTAPYFIGNGAALTGLSASKIFNGTSEANIGASGGNANITIGGTSNVFVVATTGIYTTGLSSVSGNITGGNLLTGGLISAAGTITGTSHLGAVVSVTANVTGGNLLTGGLVSATGAITGAAITGSSLTVSTGNITGGNLILSGAITDSAQLDIQTSAGNANIVLTPNGSGNVNISSNIIATSANATANIGSSTTFFNRLFAQATTALYADLAEVYRSDAPYPPGTVLVFGGTQEVTMSTESHDVKIAGVVSTHPAHVMNSGLQSEFTVEVGLIGRVPCQVIGPISAGDRVVSSNRAGVAERLDMTKYQPGVIIGKALESYPSTDVGTIEVVVGRL